MKTLHDVSKAVADAGKSTTYKAVWEAAKQHGLGRRIGAAFLLTEAEARKLVGICRARKAGWRKGRKRKTA